MMPVVDMTTEAGGQSINGTTAMICYDFILGLTDKNLNCGISYVLESTTRSLGPTI